MLKMQKLEILFPKFPRLPLPFIIKQPYHLCSHDRPNRIWKLLPWFSFLLFLYAPHTIPHLIVRVYTFLLIIKLVFFMFLYLLLTTCVCYFLRLVMSLIFHDLFLFSVVVRLYRLCSHFMIIRFPPLQLVTS